MANGTSDEEHDTNGSAIATAYATRHRFTVKDGAKSWPTAPRGLNALL